MHDMLYFSHPQYMSTPLFTEPVKFMEKVAARNASHILTVSQVSANEIMKYLHVRRNKVQVVLSSGPLVLEHNPASADRRDDLILAIGNRRPHKNFEGLVRALAEVDESVRPTIVITGSRGDDPLLPIVTELHLEKWVDLRSWVTDADLSELYATASALVMPSFAEGFGLPILEAMGVGLPVLVSDLPVLREVAGNAAVYFDPADTASIARAITRIVTDADLRARLEDAGRQQARQFSWEKTARETLEGFRIALSSPRRPRKR
jgi:glycosyltransferase involved in cell wall biosynthesis